MSEESEIRIERIKKILGFEHDSELAEFCGGHQSSMSNWRNRGFIKPIERMFDGLLDVCEKGKQPRIGRPPKLTIGQRISRARKDKRLSQRDLAERMYGAEGFSDNALRMRGSRLEKLEAIDDDTLERVAQALGIPKEAL
jgi:hypothetical protein